MGEGNNIGARVVQIDITREAKRKTFPILMESEECRQCRMKMRKLTEFIYLAAEVADELK
jgi:hypothetical protein